MIIILIQFDGAQQAVVFLQRLFRDQRLQCNGCKERGGADTGYQSHGGHTVLHGIEHTDIHLFRLVDLIGQHHVGDSVVSLHLSGEQMLATVRVGEGRHAHIQRDLDTLVVH